MVIIISKFSVRALLKYIKHVTKFLRKNLFACLHEETSSFPWCVFLFVSFSFVCFFFVFLFFRLFVSFRLFVPFFCLLNTSSSATRP